MGTVEESVDMETVVKIMNRNWRRYILVTKANDIIGYLTDGDLSKAFSNTDKKYILGHFVRGNSEWVPFSLV